MLEFGGGLEVIPSCSSPWLLVTSRHSTFPVALQVDEAQNRCRFGLALFGGSRIVEVSRDPGAWFGALRSAANYDGEHRDRWASAAAAGLDRLGVNEGWWGERRGGAAEHIALGAAWPLLRGCDFTAHDPISLPRWAAGLCEGPNVRSATTRMLDDRASRRVTRLVAEKLSGRPEWWPLALVLAMPRLDAGQVGDLLTGLDDEFRCDDVQFALLANSLGSFRPDHAIRLLQSSARDGSPTRLLSALDGLTRARGLVPRLPTTISALEETVASVLVPLPPPNQTRSQPARRPRSQATTNAPPAMSAQRRTPPTPVAPPAETFEHPEAWTHLDGATLGDVALVLPTGPADLQRWGSQLKNCLGSYKAQVDNGRRMILGIQIRGRLAGAVEVDPARRSIVQIEAANNRPLPKATKRTVTAMLYARGAITRT